MLTLFADAPRRAKVVENDRQTGALVPRPPK